ncbi:MAG: thymidine phosphorylase [archaeon]
MILKSRNLNWLAGRPVVILNSETAKKLNINVNERLGIKNPRTKKTVYAVVDIFSRLVKENYLGLSREVIQVLNTKDNEKLEVQISELGVAASLIKKKVSGEHLTKSELNTLVSEIVHNNLTESEIAYFIAAEKLNGMSLDETINLTKAMVKTGNQLKLHSKIIADKHCIGGIAGNRTTPIVVSICAAAGLTMPKTSSRAITSAAGTADVIETISNVDFSATKLKEIVSKTNACLAWGGSLNLAPSDDKIIRVERILNLDVEPQLLASIMSKKIAAGATHLLIDIPYGKSAKEKTKSEARKLGNKFKKISKYFNIKIKVAYTDGNMPIGNGIGPVLEMIDVISVLKNNKNSPQDLKNKALFLASKILKLCNIKHSKKVARAILESGEAYKKFKEIINAQNSKSLDSQDFESRVKKLHPAKLSRTITAKKDSKILGVDNKTINSLCHILGTPETKSAGVYLYQNSSQNQNIKKGDKIITLYTESKDKLEDAIKFYEEFEPIKLS